MAGVLAALRAGTRVEHDAIEARLDWATRASDRERYRHWLERLYGFHAAWEPAVAVAIADPDFTAPRRRLALLADDLARLGSDERAALPRPMIAFASRAAALGSMYVIEGSTLGGQLIARHVEATLGFRPAYHAGYGKRTGAMWRGFQARLERGVAHGEIDATVASATATFGQLGDWLTV